MTDVPIDRVEAVSLGSSVASTMAPAGGLVTLESGLPLHWNGDFPLLPVDTPARRRYLRLKRVFDFALAFFAIVVFMPLLAAIALAIRFSGDGPVLFRQVRRGAHGTSFELLKFRTMRLEDCDAAGTAQAEERDPRVTRFGAWLRRTSLDELPQLFNILRGEMSFCGPRPHVPGQLAAGRPYREVVPYYDLRHAVTPGLTGWAQANGFRGSTREAARAKARVDHDIAYIQNASIWLDLKIIARTARQEFLSGNGT